jgi:integrase
MAQKGQVFRRYKSWFVRYWYKATENGQTVWRQKCVKLAEYSDRFRTKSDLRDLVAEKLAGIEEADKCPHSSDSFVNYVEQVYLPFVLRTMKPSTYAGYSTYWNRYLKPRVGKYALRDFTIAIVASLLKDISGRHQLNRDTVTKIRSVISGIFSYAMSEGHFPARSAADNPASRARIPESATQPKRTDAATFEEVQGYLKALAGMPLERAAVGILALTGVRPSEARGLRWEEWDRAKQHIAIRRGVWHRIVGTTKTEKSERFVTVTDELREILLDFWKAQGSPISGYILAGPRKSRPVILDNLAKRSIVPALNRCSICKETESAEHKGHEFQRNESLPVWHGWYSLRRFVGTEVRMKSDSETSAKALGNSKAVADKHYIKPETVLPDVRKAVNDAISGLIR